MEGLPVSLISSKSEGDRRLEEKRREKCHKRETWVKRKVGIFKRGGRQIFIPRSFQYDAFKPPSCSDSCWYSQNRKKESKWRGLSMSLYPGLPSLLLFPLSNLCFGSKWVESFPILACLDFACGCSLCARLFHREFRLLYLLLSPDKVRHVPVVAGLSPENLSYWIWKLLKQSGRPGSLIFMLILGLLSSCPVRAWHWWSK